MGQSLDQPYGMAGGPEGGGPEGGVPVPTGAIPGRLLPPSPSLVPALPSALHQSLTGLPQKGCPPGPVGLSGAWSCLAADARHPVQPLDALHRGLH